jgi:hypothetical protein
MIRAEFEAALQAADRRHDGNEKRRRATEGTVMCQNLPRLPAPSISAAS